MELYLVRHAVAVRAAPSGDDARRALTDKGRRRFKESVHGLDRLGVTFDRIYHSPFLRAMETAELLTPLLDGESVACSELADAPSQALLDGIEGERVALVGHEPWMSDLCAWLVTGWRVFDGQSNPTPIEFDKGAVAWLSGELAPGRMTLRALWTPRTLRRLGRK